jgi:hypothetical protein
VSKAASRGAISRHLRHLAEDDFFAAERPYLLECTGPY